MYMVNQVEVSQYEPQNTKVAWYNPTTNEFRLWRNGTWVLPSAPQPEGMVTSDTIKNIWSGSQEAYDSIQEKDPNTFYVVI